jgi:hypothetical protein
VKIILFEIKPLILREDLNQRTQGSSPCVPTNKINNWAPGGRQGVVGGSPTRRRSSDPHRPRAVHPGRKVSGEASVGERIGQPLTRVRIIPGADAGSYGGRQHAERVNASALATRPGQRRSHVQTLFARKPGDPTSDSVIVARKPASALLAHIPLVCVLGSACSAADGSAPDQGGTPHWSASGR